MIGESGKQGGRREQIQAFWQPRTTTYFLRQSAGGVRQVSFVCCETLTVKMPTLASDAHTLDFRVHVCADASNSHVGTSWKGRGERGAAPHWERPTYLAHLSTLLVGNPPCVRGCCWPWRFQAPGWDPRGHGVALEHVSGPFFSQSNSAQSGPASLPWRRSGKVLPGAGLPSAEGGCGGEGREL